jgi:hypothetical protein
MNAYTHFVSFDVIENGAIAHKIEEIGKSMRKMVKRAAELKETGMTNIKCRWEKAA